MDIRRELRTIRLITQESDGVDGFRKILKEAEIRGYVQYDLVYARITHKGEAPYEGPVAMFEREGELAVLTTRDRKFKLYECRDLGETPIHDLSSVVEN